MKTALIVFLVIATVFALATIAYVVVDLVIEKKNGPKI